MRCLEPPLVCSQRFSLRATRLPPHCTPRRVLTCAASPAACATAASSPPADVAPPPPPPDAARAALLARLATVPDRGIFGLPQAEREEVDALIRALEDTSADAAPCCVERLPSLAGDWRLIYTTLSVRGGARTALGLRSGVRLGELVQTITPDAASPDGRPSATGAAVTRVCFSLGGAWQGAFTVVAAYAAAPPRRVDITLKGSSLRPAALEAMFGPQQPLLLGIFNPEGWLDTTFVGDGLRIGRDDKGQAFVCERMA